MLQSLEVRNYRNLRHLTIPKLGRVNLLVGKNNTGKTSVLEAVSILVNGENLKSLYSFLISRKEFFSVDEITVNEQVKSFSNLFTGRKAIFEKNQGIYISDKYSNTSFDLRLINYNEVSSFPIDIGVLPSPQLLATFGKIYTLKQEVLERTPLTKIGLELKLNDKEIIKPFGKNTLGDILDSLTESEDEDYKSLFVKSRDLQQTDIANWWRKVQLTDNENDILSALHLLDSSIEKMSFARLDDEEYPIVKTKNSPLPIPLQSMGDGINRILTIILAMVNCENGYLLIDEFENGLHYSVQEKLWEVIFYLAQRLNIQVFATTHSSDTIHAFTHIANAKPENKDAQLIQLRNRQDTISAITFSAEELLLADEVDYLDLR
jgi:AAA15 family ATPase/GTPase